MSLKFFAKSSLVLSLLASATTVYAERVPCPSINTIKKAASQIDVAQKTACGFVVSTSTLLNVNDQSWTIQVNNLHVANKNDAIAAGQNAAKNIAFVNIKGKLKSKDGKRYLCEYGPTHVIAISGFNKKPPLT